MKVKIVADRDGETKVVELPMEEKKLLEIQGSVLDRNTIGYIAGAEVKYYDENGTEVENIFLLNRKLKGF
ncbi:hypothetical protein [Clostridium cellulovorans]|uniref:Uncharacterized protein n=1 Tax=Clostridium cellulovorans (strain ATCC 35296 / DSM 3052 / OCM 3 / 743B) TaxID=573061 RepID=D9SLX2_CLOC7|nr:hypothetical protein [Clostridium cellulovorans]ADL51703.1 hypothetical protein Clocel_1959 [Clostridium cellulovorans 743B]